jgi:hypothetical protein
MLLTWYRLQILLLAVFLSILFSSPFAAQSEPAQNDGFLRGSSLAQKMDVLKNSSETLEARWSRLSGFQKAAAYMKRLTPFYSWINLCTAVDAHDKSFLMGDCLDDETRSYFMLPIEEFQRTHSATVDRLWAASELDAMTYASAALGQDTFEVTQKNAMSIAQLVAGGIVGFIFFKRSKFSLIGWMSAIGWTNMKRAFYLCVAVWLLGGAALQILGKISGFSVALMNLQTLVLVIFGGLSIILGIVLFGRWVWNRNPQY